MAIKVRRDRAAPAVAQAATAAWSGPDAGARLAARRGTRVSLHGPPALVEAVERLALLGGLDATGAGDAFDGAFLVEWLRTGDPFAAARYANVAAALKTLGFGAVAPMPRRADVEAALARVPA